MDEKDFAATIVGAASEQYNARLRSIAAGQEAEIAARAGDEGADRVALVGARPFLLYGLDVDLDALDGLAFGSVQSVFADVAAHGGDLRSAELQAALEGMFATGVLHERERAKREKAAAAEQARDDRASL